MTPLQCPKILNISTAPWFIYNTTTERAACRFCDSSTTTVQRGLACSFDKVVQNKAQHVESFRSGFLNTSYVSSVFVSARHYGLNISAGAGGATATFLLSPHLKRKAEYWLTWSGAGRPLHAWLGFGRAWLGFGRACGL